MTDTFYCTNESCPHRGRGRVLPWRHCGNDLCCRSFGTHYPLCESCGSVMRQVTSAPSVIWTGTIGKRYRDPSKEGYHGDSGGEDGFWAYTRNTPDKKPTPVRIETWQQAREFAKANGCADPREVGHNMIPTEDGKGLQNPMGMPGTEV